MSSESSIESFQARLPGVKSDQPAVRICNCLAEEELECLASFAKDNEWDSAKYQFTDSCFRCTLKTDRIRSPMKIVPTVADSINEWRRATVAGND